MSKKSLLDVAYEVISNLQEPVKFQDLWVKVNEEQETDSKEMEGKIGKFYTNLLTDGRFVNLGDNTWDLRDKYKFDKVHIDMGNCYSDDEDDKDELNDEEKDPFVEDENDENEDEESEYEPEESSSDDL